MDQGILYLHLDFIILINFKILLLSLLVLSLLLIDDMLGDMNLVL